MSRPRASSLDDEAEDELGGIAGVDTLAAFGKGNAKNTPSSGFRIVTDLHTETPLKSLPPQRTNAPVPKDKKEVIALPTLPTPQCDQCDKNLSQTYCDSCGLNLCDECDSRVHEEVDGKVKEEMSEHYREPITARLSLVLDTFRPLDQPNAPSQSPSQQHSVALSMGAPSVTGQFDLRVGPQGPTISENAYNWAQNIAQIKQTFGDLCDKSHPDLDTSPVATIYCDTCGFNYCSACDSKAHPGGTASGHDRHVLDYQPEAPPPHHHNGQSIAGEEKASGPTSPGPMSPTSPFSPSGLMSPSATAGGMGSGGMPNRRLGMGAGPNSLTVSAALNQAAGGTGVGGGGRKTDISNLPDYMQLEIQKARMRADKSLAIKNYAAVKQIQADRQAITRGSG